MELKLYLHEDYCTDILVQKEDFSYQKFDPFTDANDDYAVLDWMRETKIDHTVLTEIEHEWSMDYQIGDYARAACKVIE